MLEREIEEMKSLAPKMQANADELVYFLVCAKMPYYVSKVDKSLKRSFVEAAVSLYYLERYYLAACISRLFEVALLAGSYV